MDRPTGVTILAILNFLGAGLYILIGLGFMLGMGIIGAMVGQSGQEGAGGGMAMLAGLGAIAGIVFIVLSLIPLAIGIGLWKLKNWARQVTIVLMLLRLLLLAPGLLISLLRSDLVGLGLQLLFAGVYGWILWYLYQPHLKQLFTTAAATQPPISS